MNVVILKALEWRTFILANLLHAVGMFGLRLGLPETLIHHSEMLFPSAWAMHIVLAVVVHQLLH